MDNINDQGSNEAPPPEGLDDFINQIDTKDSPDALNPSVTPPGLDDFIAPELKGDKYSTTAQLVKTGLEGAAEGVAGPFAPILETQLGISTPEEILARRETNPTLHGGAQAASLVGGMALTGGGLGLARVLGEVGAAAEAAATGLGITSKIGSAAIKAAAENAAFGLSDEASKLALNDPNQSVETAMLDVGIMSVLGAAVGGGASSAGELWKAAKGSQTAGVLKAITDKTGGAATIDQPIQDIISRSGVELDPVLKGALSKDPKFQEMFNTLRQTDINASGKKVQEIYNNFRKDSADSLVNTLGKNAEDIEKLPELSKYETGKDIGNTLANEYNTQITPIAEKFDNYKSKYGSVELPKDVVSPTGQVLEKGVINNSIDKISKLALDQGWAASPSSDIMKEVNRVIKELPLQNDLKDLSNYISQVGNNTFDPLNPTLSRAGSMMKGILKDAEASTISDVIGKKEGEAASELFNEARASYGRQSALKEALNDRLHIRGGNTSNYSKMLREMAQTDGETLLNRLSGVRDANLLDFLAKNYPETALKLKNYHIDNLLKTAADKAADGFSINSENLIKNVGKLSPELKNFIASPEQLTKIEAIGKLNDLFNKLPYNHSNTARTIDKLFERGPSTALGLIAGVISHNPFVGAAAGYLAKTLGRDIPDAAKLALLKYMGSSKPINAEGFKAAAEMIHGTMQGEKSLSKSVKEIFKEIKEGGTSTPSEGERAKLENQLKQLQKEPNLMTNVGEKEAYYMPDHGVAMARTTSGLVQFLNSQRPYSPQLSPLDPKLPLSNIQKADYDNKLNIAINPLILLNKVKTGEISAGDVRVLRSMYPNLYDRMASKLTENMVDAAHKGKNIPYNTRMGISIFLGKPLDSTMTPNSIQLAQLSNMPLLPPNSQIQGNGSKSNGRPSSPALGHVFQPYMTPLQAAQRDHIGRGSK